LRAALVRAIASLFCAVTLFTNVHARADQPAPQPFDIRPQSLASALTEFARQSQHEILFSPDVVADKLSSGVRGTMLPPAALVVLLKDSGLQISSTPNGALLVGAPGSSTPAGAPIGSERAQEGKKNSSGPFRLAQSDSPANTRTAAV